MTRAGKTRVVLVGGAVALPTHLQPDGIVAIDGEEILYAGPRAGAPALRAGWEKIDLRGSVVAPGFVDLHINGFGGVEVFGAGRVALAKMGKALAGRGVTSYLPTLVTSPFPALMRAVARLAALAAEPAPAGASEPLGIYLEGPFLSDARRGAHPSQDLRSPRADSLQQIVELMGARTRVVAIAPELPGAQDAIRTLTRAGIVVALAHSNADAEICRQATLAGATHVAHLFNAMGPIHHRAPGLAGFTLGSAGVTAEIVADGHHVDRWMVAAAWRALGPHRLALVSDALAPAGVGLANGASVRLESGLGRVIIRRMGGAIPRAENASGTLVGSLASLADCVRYAVHQSGIPLHDAITMASATPARIAGVGARKGHLVAGADADVVVLDAELEPSRAWVRGRPVSTSHEPREEEPRLPSPPSRLPLRRRPQRAPREKARR